MSSHSPSPTGIGGTGLFQCPHTPPASHDAIYKGLKTTIFNRYDDPKWECVSVCHNSCKSNRTICYRRISCVISCVMRMSVCHVGQWYSPLDPTTKTFENGHFQPLNSKASFWQLSRQVASLVGGRRPGASKWLIRQAGAVLCCVTMGGNWAF